MRIPSKFVLGLTAAGVLSAGVIGGIAAQSPGDPVPEVPTDGDAPELKVAHADHRRGGERLATIAGILGTEPEEIKAVLMDGGTLADAAEAAGVDVQVLIDALVAEISARVDAAVEEDRIDEERAAALLENAEARVTTMVNEGRPGERAKRHYQRHHKRGVMRLVGVSAGVIGVEPQALAEALRDGSSIAEFAAANGVDESTLIDGILAEMAGHLSEAVANGRITQEEADAKLAEAESRLAEAVHKVRGEREAPPVGTSL